MIAAHRTLFLSLMMAYGLATYGVLVWSVSEHRPLIALVAGWLASPVAMAIGRRLEGSSAWRLPHPARASWAYLFGDSLGLAPALAFAALAWRRLDVAAWYGQLWWPAVCLMVGIAAGLGYHFLYDGPLYRRWGATGALASPTKLLHDFVAYPVLAGGLLFAGLPVILHLVPTSPWSYWVLGGIGIWIIGTILDTGIAGLHRLDPRDHHPTDWQWHSSGQQITGSR